MHDALKVAGAWATFVTMIFLAVLLITTDPAAVEDYAYVWAQ